MNDYTIRFRESELTKITIGIIIFMQTKNHANCLFFVSFYNPNRL
ncbi:hypothetical protein SAMN06265376_101321 [Dokdonia pacifica]|uniref:Uncharacterized protein n=1 Tax=Dokdonia pacifica TaxID=1627892 RepID=A0A238VSV9_9FLAO|nr:hypothetical protein SAMN06265376_101321 [Dokdonia pacifica]